MKLTTKIHSPIQFIQIILFVQYNFFYVMYRYEKVSNNIQLFSLFLFISFNILIWLITDMKNRPIKWGYPFSQSLIIIFSVLIISFLFQMYNSDFQSYLITSIISLFTPILTAFVLINTIHKGDYIIYVNILLIKTIMIFLIDNLFELKLENLLLISWGNSYSPFESSMAHEFLLLECIYLFFDKKKSAFISMVLCMLSMKRLSFLLAPLLFIFTKKIIQLSGNRTILKGYTYVFKLITFLSPFVILFLYKDQTTEFLINTIGFDLNSFMSGRKTIYKLLINNIPYFNGFGSVNTWLLQFSYNFFGTTWNGILHNDVLRVYFELTIIGFLIFFNSFINIFKDNFWTILMGGYVLFVMITSHLLDYYPMWLTFYIGCSLIYSSIDKNENKGEENVSF